MVKATLLTVERCVNGQVSTGNIKENVSCVVISELRNGTKRKIHTNQKHETRRKMQEIERKRRKKKENDGTDSDRHDTNDSENRDSDNQDGGNKKTDGAEKENDGESSSDTNK